MTKILHEKRTEGRTPRGEATTRAKAVERPSFLQAAEQVMRKHADALRELAKH